MSLYDHVLEIMKSVNKFSKVEGKLWSLLKKKGEIIHTATGAVMYSSYWRLKSQEILKREHANRERRPSALHFNCKKKRNWFILLSSEETDVTNKLRTHELWHVNCGKLFKLLGSTLLIWCMTKIPLAP